MIIKLELPHETAFAAGHSVPFTYLRSFNGRAAASPSPPTLCPFSSDTAALSLWSPVGTWWVFDGALSAFCSNNWYFSWGRQWRFWYWEGKRKNSDRSSDTRGHGRVLCRSISREVIPIKSYCPSSPTNSYQMQVYLLLTGIWTEPSTCRAVQSPSDCSLGTKHSAASGGDTLPAFLLQPSTRSYPSITPKGKPYPSCLGAVPLPVSDCLKQDKDFGSSQPSL